MENYRVHPFMQNKNGYEIILRAHCTKKVCEVVPVAFFLTDCIFLVNTVSEFSSSEQTAAISDLAVERGGSSSQTAGAHGGFPSRMVEQRWRGQLLAPSEQMRAAA